MFTKTILLDHLRHNGIQHIRIDFPFNREWNEIAKTIPAQWTSTHKCFYVENKPENLQKILNAFRGKVWVDMTRLKAREELFPKTSNQKTKSAQTNMSRLSPETLEKINGYKLYLKSIRYSDRTVENYFDMVSSFFGFCLTPNPSPHGEGSNSPKTIYDITNADVEKFNHDYIIKNNYSVSYQRQLVSALKLFYARIPGLMRKLSIEELERPHARRRLPTVLSEEEILGILKNTPNLKHKSILACIYSSGLRISELLNLQLKDIDVHRLQIRVMKGKGDKDRVVGLSKMFLLLLEQYVNDYQPKDYVFNGEDGGKYSETSVRNILHAACRKAGIKKKVTPHVLRHSYATHMLENGVDLRYIQELLGHRKPETTMIYAHVAQKKLVKIESPLDAIANKLGADNQQGLLRLSADKNG